LVYEGLGVVRIGFPLDVTGDLKHTGKRRIHVEIVFGARPYQLDVRAIGDVVIATRELLIKTGCLLEVLDHFAVCLGHVEVLRVVGACVEGEHGNHGPGIVSGVDGLLSDLEKHGRLFDIEAGDRHRVDFAVRRPAGRKGNVPGSVVRTETAVGENTVVLGGVNECIADELGPPEAVRARIRVAVPPERPGSLMRYRR
jgi:hypothetical protein